MTQTLDTELLRTFVSIAETGSFTEASSRVGRTQSAVSMQMTRLQEILGRRSLFERKGRTVYLTREGEILLSHARRILGAHQDALAEFCQSDLSGSVKLGTHEDYIGSIMPGLITRFTENYPNIQVNVIAETPNNLNDLIRQGKVDVSVTVRPQAQTSASGTSVILRESHAWVTSASHHAHEQEPLPIAIYQNGNLLRQWVLSILSAQQKPYRIAYTCLSTHLLSAVVRAGLAVGVLPVNNISSGVRILGEQDGFPALPTFELIAQINRRRKSKAIDCLVEYLVETIRSVLTTVQSG